MKYHWYIVIHQAGAQVFEQENVSEDLLFKCEIPNPDGKLKDQEIATDKRGYTDNGKNSYSWTTNPAEQESVKFAKEISEFLKKEDSKKSFETLTIVAAPQMLGKVRSELPSSVKQKVREEISKNLGEMKESVVKQHLARFQLQREPLQAG